VADKDTNKRTGDYKLFAILQSDRIIGTRIFLGKNFKDTISIKRREQTIIGRVKKNNGLTNDTGQKSYR
jgi:hypothetical protein